MLAFGFKGNSWHRPGPTKIFQKLFETRNFKKCLKLEIHHNRMVYINYIIFLKPIISYIPRKKPSLVSLVQPCATLHDPPLGAAQMSSRAQGYPRNTAMSVELRNNDGRLQAVCKSDGRFCFGVTKKAFWLQKWSDAGRCSGVPAPVRGDEPASQPPHFKVALPLLLGVSFSGYH